MEYKSAWLIIAKANLHVGNENVLNHGLIDKAIQRDVVTGLPCVNSSSIKGAINEYATMVKKLDSNQRKAIFGVDKNDKKNTQRGNSAFFDASLIALPRPKSETLYELVTSHVVLERFISQMKDFGIALEIEELRSKICEECGKNLIVMPDNKEFVNLCSDDELPIIARNCLENGQSVNLWYEQILPKESILGTIVLSEEEIVNTLMDGKLIQIGANATIGYGYCKFVKL